jgi:hypothetical protein
MGKKALIMYASHTGNTEKVVQRFKETLIHRGWACDLFRIRKKADDILRPSFVLDDYDFLCVGSGVILHLPYNEVLNVIRRYNYGIDPRIPLRLRDEDIPYIKEPITDVSHEDISEIHRKIVIGPECKKAVVFLTYAGYEFGPAEAKPALDLLALEVEHLHYRIVGKFCCPGKYLNHPTPRTFHGDIRDRPNEADLRDAQVFIEEILDSLDT